MPSRERLWRAVKRGNGRRLVAWRKLALLTRNNRDPPVFCVGSSGLTRCRTEEHSRERYHLPRRSSRGRNAHFVLSWSSLKRKKHIQGNSLMVTAATAAA